MKLYILALIFFVHTFGISEAFPTDEPQKVYRMTYRHQSADWYARQSELWRKIVNEKPEHAEAWQNYYLATDYSLQGKGEQRKQKLFGILNEMKRAVPESFEYHYMAGRFHNGDIAWLKKAHEIRPENPAIYYGLITHYTVNGKSGEASRYLRLLYDSRDIAPGLLSYNFNVLMSVEKNAILFTNGDNDTYPAWILQAVKSVRPDVTILNVHLIHSYREYLSQALEAKQIKLDFSKIPGNTKAGLLKELSNEMKINYSDIPVYFALTVNTGFLDELKQDLYIVGLAYRYHPQGRLDNLAILKKNVEQQFQLDYLVNDWYNEAFVATHDIVKSVNTNYVMLFVMLGQHFNLAGQEQQASSYLDRARIIADKANNPQLMKYVEDAL